MPLNAPSHWSLIIHSVLRGSSCEKRDHQHCHQHTKLLPLSDHDTECLSIVRTQKQSVMPYLPADRSVALFEQKWEVSRWPCSFLNRKSKSDAAGDISLKSLQSRPGELNIRQIRCVHRRRHTLIRSFKSPDVSGARYNVTPWQLSPPRFDTNALSDRWMWWIDTLCPSCHLSGRIQRVRHNGLGDYFFSLQTGECARGNGSTLRNQKSSKPIMSHTWNQQCLCSEGCALTAEATFPHSLVLLFVSLICLFTVVTLICSKSQEEHTTDHMLHI